MEVVFEELIRINGEPYRFWIEDHEYVFKGYLFYAGGNRHHTIRNKWRRIPACNDSGEAIMERALRRWGLDFTI